MSYGKYTLLEVVQSTLEALGSDEVNSISDSVEATQIATIAKDAYYELLGQKEWPFLWELGQLTALADADHPNWMQIPANATRIKDVVYDCTDPNDSTSGALRHFISVDWMDPSEFIYMVQQRNTEADNVTVYTSFNDIDLPIYTDTNPTYWTSLDDEYVIFDSWRSDIDSSMQASKSQCMQYIWPAFTISDDFIADMPNHMFATWLADVKATAFIYMRQENSPVDVARARRGLAVLRRSASRTNEDDGRVHFGRRV